jgi:hypothetical protein
VHGRLVGARESTTTRLTQCGAGSRWRAVAVLALVVAVFGALSCTIAYAHAKPIAHAKKDAAQCKLVRVYYASSDGAWTVGYACNNHVTKENGVVGYDDECHTELHSPGGVPWISEETVCASPDLQPSERWTTD